jgi:predicted MFS family arabinose efflux permease
LRPDRLPPVASLSDTATPADDAGPKPALLLALFLALHIINHIDRNLVASLAPHIIADLQLTRAQFALIAGLAFSLVYAAMALGAGLLADRLGHQRVMTAGAGTWSLFTAACGLATGFWSLIAIRPFVAAGEATLVPTATNIILAHTPEARRATATGIFFMGIPLGIGGSYLVAAWLGPLIGWRACFFLMGGLGLVLTLAASRLRNERKAGGTGSRARLAGWWRAMRANPRLRWATIAIVLFHAHMATAAFTQLWLTSDKGLSEARAGSLYGGMFILLGLLGAAGSGALTDGLHRRRGTDRAQTLACVMLALAPLIIAYRLAPGGSAPMLIGMGASVLWFTAAYGPCFAIIEKELPADLKATATGLNMLMINVLMIGALGFAIGAASDALAARGIADSWTWPLLGADLVAMTAIVALFAAARR